MLEQYFDEDAAICDVNRLAIENAKRKKNRTFVFGGHVGGIAVDALRKENLEPDGCFVTDDYWREGLSCHGVRVYRESEIVAMNRKTEVNVVPACVAATQEAEARLHEKMRCEMIYLDLDWPHLSENSISKEYVKKHLPELEETFQKTFR